MGSTRGPQPPQAQSVFSNLGGASYCWESLLESDYLPTPPKTNVCNFPAGAGAPLGLCLYAPPQYRKILLEGPFSARHLVDGLLRELHFRNQGLRLRKVTWLRWCLPQTVLDSADVTEIMYFLGRQFHLGEVDDHCYSVAFRLNELNQARAALFKGLGFNSAELLIEKEADLSLPALQDCLSIATDFHYQHINLLLSRPLAGLPEMLAQLSAAGLALPDSVALSRFQHCADGAATFDSFFTGMHNLGYQVLGNDCFVGKNSPLARAQIEKHLRLTCHGYNCQNVSDIIGLGPANISSWGDRRRRNPEQLPGYLSAEFSSHCDPILATNSFKPVLDQILCYHSLDLDYFRRRYQWQLLPLIERAWQPLQTLNPALYKVQQGSLSLTSEGVLRLSALCDALILQLREIMGHLPKPASVAD